MSCIKCQIQDCGMQDPKQCPVNLVWANEEQFAYIGISMKTYAYWMFLDNKVAHPQALEETEPYQVKIWSN